MFVNPLYAAANIGSHPLRRAARTLIHLILLRRGYTRAQQWKALGAAEAAPDLSSPLRAYFRAVKSGPGIWKWDHYFDIYHHHFQRFRGKEVHILEIGIYSGGSLAMWQNYFGPNCHVYGVDIEESCKAYEGGSVKVFIGDQADRQFWKRFKEEVPILDLVVDDGGHKSTQQIVTLEELLPHLRAGGVYVCEDVHGAFNGFASYVLGFAQNLNDGSLAHDESNNERRIVSKATGIQSTIRSVNLYPFMTVIEKRDKPVSELVAPKHGAQWQPFLR